MSTVLSIHNAYEREKNLKALGITAAIAAAILAIVFLIRWDIPKEENIPPVEEIVEIEMAGDLGGLGNAMEQYAGDPAPEPAPYTPPETVASSSGEESSRDVAEDNQTDDAPPVTRQPVSDPKSQRISDRPSTNRPVTNPTPAPPQPAAPQPKAVVRGPITGGNGSGGNGADRYEPGGTGGDGPGGSGGGPGNGGGGRPTKVTIRGYAVNKNFTDDVTENGSIVLQVRVDADGKIQSMNAIKISIGDPVKHKQIAMRRAREIDYPKNPNGSVVEVPITFRVN